MITIEQISRSIPYIGIGLLIFLIIKNITFFYIAIKLKNHLDRAKKVQEDLIEKIKQLNNGEENEPRDTTNTAE